jgi:uncharacterized protein involved in exopolysaccharide biosynthesis
MTFHTSRRLWYWRVVHYLSIIRFRRRVVLAAVFLGIVVAIIATISTKPIYASRAVVLDKDSPTNTDEVIRAAEYRINHPGDHGGY